MHSALWASSIGRVKIQCIEFVSFAKVNAYFIDRQTYMFMLKWYSAKFLWRYLLFSIEMYVEKIKFWQFWQCPQQNLWVPLKVGILVSTTLILSCSSAIEVAIAKMKLKECKVLLLITWEIWKLWIWNKQSRSNSNQAWNFAKVITFNLQYFVSLQM